jgi:hypothetical protein
MREVWYVQGDPDAVGLWPNLFDTKEAAEAYARLVFPDEGENKRYARVYFRTVLTTADLTVQGGLK